MKFKRKNNAGFRSLTDDELIFNLEEEHTGDLTHSHTYSTQAVSSHCIKESGSLKFKSKSASASSTRPKFSSLRLEKHVHNNDVGKKCWRKSDKSFYSYFPHHNSYRNHSSSRFSPLSLSHTPNERPLNHSVDAKCFLSFFSFPFNFWIFYSIQIRHCFVFAFCVCSTKTNLDNNFDR